MNTARSHRVIAQTILFLLGALASVAFIITKSPTLLDQATSGSYAYGDLYRMCKVRRFKPSQPQQYGPAVNIDSIQKGDVKPAEARAIFDGDSFGFCDWGEGTFSTQLEAATHEKTFRIYNNTHFDISEHPIRFLKEQAPRTPVGRVFVFERVERNLIASFGEYSPLFETKASATASRFKLIRNQIFENTEARHETLLKNSRLTFPLMEAWNTAAFEISGQISTETPMYSLAPPFLFFADECACFQAQHDDKLINFLADRIAFFNRILQEQFGCTLIFLPLPNKITIYSRLATTKPYDNFLPRLCAATKQRGVLTVDVYSEFKSQTNLLYWPTDTHWNAAGIRVAVDQTLKDWPQK